MPHIAILRVSGSDTNLNSYNNQELGLAKALVDRGFKVTLFFSNKKKGETIINHNGHEIKVFFLPYISLKLAFSYSIGLKKLLQSMKIDILQLEGVGMLMSYIAQKWAKKWKLKTVVVQGNYELTRKKIPHILENLFMQTFGKYILKNVGAVGCKTKMARDFLLKFYKRPMFITPIGLDETRFVNSADIPYRKKLGIENKKVLLYIGNFEQRRNVLFLLDVLKNLPDNFVLVMAGSGNLFNDVKNRIESLGLKERCFLLGKLPQTELPSLYKESDLFLLATDYEIYGMVILESMFFGAAVMSTVSAGSQMLVENEIDGFILNKIDTNLWTEKITSIFDSGKVIQCGENAQKKIKNNFLWNKTVDSFIEMYNSLDN
ncbi:MAG: glycosyltransferase family 4 protein [Clostridia bacterium]|nr:glycosyltransferase family 4 protein [Clostridia bacterium]